MLIHGDGGVICWACSVCRRPGCPGKDLVFLWRDGDADAECHVVHEGCIPDLVTSTLLTDE